MKRASWGFLVKLIFTLGAVAYFIFVIDFRKIVDELRGTNGLLFALSLAANLGSRWLTSWQTALAMRLHGGLYPTSQMFSITLRTMFYGFFMPGELGVAAAKYYKISRVDGQRAQTAATIIYLRIINLVILLSVGLAAMLIHWPFENRGMTWVVLGILGVLLAGLILFYVNPGWWTGAGHAAVRAVQRFIPGLGNRLQKMISSFEVFGTPGGGQLAGLWLTGIGYKILATLSFWLATQALGVEIGLAAMFWIQSVVELAQMLPVTLFNLGTREVSMIFLLGLFGVSSVEALGSSLLLYVQRLIQVLAGGMLELKDFLRHGRGAKRDVR